jgi:protoheme IX farnesyltransferase
MSTTDASARAGTPSPARFGDYMELTKPRLSMLSVITTLVGYAAARPGWHPVEFTALVVGTCACAGGVAALNQWMESETDAVMPRTSDRPIPAGKIATGSAFVIGSGLCAGGLGVLFTYMHGGAAFFALLTVISYLAVYTPAKRWSTWSTEIGAVAGAFPPLIGWAAAGGGVTALGWILFAVLFFWQIPHFMAVAWTYRKDYSAVNFPMLPVRDSEGGKVARWSMVNAVALILVCLLPQALGLASTYYTGVTALLGAWFLARAVAFMQKTNRDQNARRLFITTIGWLPLQLGALVADRLIF